MNSNLFWLKVDEKCKFLYSYSLKFNLDQFILLLNVVFKF